MHLRIWVYHSCVMFEPRFNKMAQVIVNYSLEVKPGQTVFVWSQSNAAPLMLECYREILKAGGNAFLRADLPGAQEIFYEVAKDAQLDFVSPVDQVSVEEGKFDAYIRIGAEVNTRRLSSVDPAKIQRQQAALSPILAKAHEPQRRGQLQLVRHAIPHRGVCDGRRDEPGGIHRVPVQRVPRE